MNLEIFWNLLILSFRDAKKIDKHLYHELYLRSKGNNFKNKKTLMEYIFKKKSENKRAKQLAYVLTFFLLLKNMLGFKLSKNHIILSSIACDFIWNIFKT